MNKLILIFVLIWLVVYIPDVLYIYLGIVGIGIAIELIAKIKLFLHRNGF